MKANSNAKVGIMFVFNTQVYKWKCWSKINKQNINWKDCVFVYIAKHFFNEGAKIILCDINIDQANKKAHELDGIAYYMDVSNSENVKEVFTKVKSKFNQLDILVNNAAFSFLYSSACYILRFILYFICINLSERQHTLLIILPME